MPDRLLSVAQAALELGLTPRRVRFLCRSGRLGVKVGRDWAITARELRVFALVPRKGGRPATQGAGPEAARP